MLYNKNGGWNMINVYLDNCCYDRPFDDLRQEKIRQEGLKVLEEKLDL